MNKVINIRATSGGGKTTLVRSFLESYPHQQICDGDKRVLAYHLPAMMTGYSRDTFVLGSYEAVTGGCDTVSTQDKICDLIEHFSALGHVFYEGLLVSGLFSRYLNLEQRLTHAHFIYGYLDTPVQVCIERTMMRRRARGNLKLFDPNKTLVPKFRAVLATRKKFEKARRDVRTISHLSAMQIVDAWLREPALCAVA
jgi:hypothetical protein